MTQLTALLPLCALVVPAWCQDPAVVPAQADATHASAESSAAPGRFALTGLVTIESDVQRANNATGVVTATGNVRIVYSDRGVVATARQAQYFSREALVVLSGDVELIQEGGNRLLAEQVIYQVDQERLVAHPSPGQQVTSRVRISPAPAAGAASAFQATPTQLPIAPAPLP